MGFNISCGWSSLRTFQPALPPFHSPSHRYSSISGNTSSSNEQFSRPISRMRRITCRRGAKLQNFPVYRRPVFTLVNLESFVPFVISITAPSFLSPSASLSLRVLLGRATLEEHNQAPKKVAAFGHLQAFRHVWRQMHVCAIPIIHNRDATVTVL